MSRLENKADVFFRFFDALDKVKQTNNNKKNSRDEEMDAEGEEEDEEEEVDEVTDSPGLHLLDGLEF